MINWAQLGGLMPTTAGTGVGLGGSFLLFQAYAQPNCVVGTSTLTYNCVHTPFGSLGVVEFGGLGMVVGALVGLVVSLVSRSRKGAPGGG